MRRLVTAVTVLTLCGIAGGLGPAEAATPPEAALTGVAQVDGGSAHACAVMANGQVRCWGLNTSGQLGNGTTNPATRPVVVRRTGGGPLTNVLEVSAGGTFTCARVQGGQVRCWGANAAGQLGDRGTTPSPNPVVVSNVAGTGPLTGVRSITAGTNHACALLANGQVRCWGHNSEGQLGDDNSPDDATQPRVTVNTLGTGPLTGVTQVETEFNTTCARLGNRQARCWGYGGNGQLGNGTMSGSARPVIVQNVAGTGPLSAVAEVSPGEDFTCARLVNSEVRCFGRNEVGQLGTNNFVTSTRPRIVVNGSGAAAFSGAQSIFTGSQFTCVGVAGRQVRCWGYGGSGQLGNGLGTPSPRPVPVKQVAGAANLDDVTDLDAGGAFACARLTTGRAVCWGHNQQRQLGNGGMTNRLRPVFVQT